MSPLQLRMAVHVLRAGGVIAYPTEGVYGIGCDPQRVDAVARVLRLKRRAADKGLILIARALSQLDGWVRMDPTVEARVAPTWPGPVTWVVAAGPLAPSWISGGRDTLAVRVTAHPQAAALCRAFGGPLVSTSANLAGRRPARTALELRLRLPAAAVDFVVPGAVGERAGPTEIRLGETGEVLRRG